MKTTTSKKAVHFSVPMITKIIIIPNRNHYTKKHKRRIWNNHETIKRNFKRNRLEYEYEGNIWTNVLEEDQFITKDDSNTTANRTKLIHPAHHHQKS